jgi:hypothetical protein
MGNCGISQLAGTPETVVDSFLALGAIASDKEPSSSHDFCNYFYISAFENDFIARNTNDSTCLGTMDISELPEDFKMGCMESRRK